MLIWHIKNFQKKLYEGKILTQRPTTTSKIRTNKLLLVGMADSPHFQGWLKAVHEEFPHKVILIFPSDRPRFNNIIIERNKLEKISKAKIFKLHPNRRINFVLFYTLDLIFDLKWRAYFLARFIIRHKPDIIHFHEMQHGAYIYNLVSSYKKIPTNSRKIISTWGSDLTLYSWVNKHQNQLQSCLTWANILTAERTTELSDAKRFGFKGEFIAPLYITLGQDSSEISKLTKPSMRKIILIKGHQSDTGRALNALQAISTLSDQLANFEIIVYSAPISVQIQVDLLRNKNKINIRTLPRVGHIEMCKLFEQARLSISLAVSDGLPAVLVEAMSAGAFPIQSENSAGQEFLVNDENGLLVNPWDLDSIKESILKAITDDNLVDQAAILNHKVLQSKYSLKEGKLKLNQLYL